MKKRLELLLIFMVAIVSLIAIIHPVSKNTLLIEDGVYIKIEEDTLTKESATITVVCENDNTYTIGRDYYIQKYKNNKWVKLNEKEEILSTMEAIILDKNDSETFQLNWSRYYGSLDSGKYRIAKRISLKDSEKKEDKYIVGEFIIN